jgi:outer membrane protein
VKNYYLFNGYLTQLFNAVIVISALMLSSIVFAQSESREAEKIAVVDVQLAVLQTEQAQAQLAELKEQDDFKKNFKAVSDIEAELKVMVEAYQKDRAVMSAQKRAEEEKRIVEKQKDGNYIATKLQQSRKEWAEMAMEAQAKNLTRVLQNLVEEQGIGLLLRADGGVVLHAGPRYDISLQVTERLNQIK